MLALFNLFCNGSLIPQPVDNVEACCSLPVHMFICELVYDSELKQHAQSKSMRENSSTRNSPPSKTTMWRQLVLSAHASQPPCRPPSVRYVYTSPCTILLQQNPQHGISAKPTYLLRIAPRNGICMPGCVVLFCDFLTQRYRWRDCCSYLMQVLSFLTSICCAYFFPISHSP